MTSAKESVTAAARPFRYASRTSMLARLIAWRRFLRRAALARDPREGGKVLVRRPHARRARRARAPRRAAGVRAALPAVARQAPPPAAPAKLALDVISSCERLADLGSSWGSKRGRRAPVRRHPIEARAQPAHERTSRL